MSLLILALFVDAVSAQCVRTALDEDGLLAATPMASLNHGSSWFKFTLWVSFDVKKLTLTLTWHRHWHKHCDYCCIHWHFICFRRWTCLSRWCSYQSNSCWMHTFVRCTSLCIWSSPCAIATLLEQGLFRTEGECWWPCSPTDHGITCQWKYLHGWFACVQWSPCNLLCSVDICISVGAVACIQCVQNHVVWWCMWLCEKSLVAPVVSGSVTNTRYYWECWCIQLHWRVVSEPTARCVQDSSYHHHDAEFSNVAITCQSPVPVPVTICFRYV